MTDNHNPDGWGQRVSGRCPSCGHSSLFVAVGQHVTCGFIPCPNPTAVADLLLASPAVPPEPMPQTNGEGVWWTDRPAVPPEPTDG